MNKTNILITLVVILWLCAIGFGISQLWIYSNTPSLEISAPKSWPTTTKIPLSSKNPTLVMFAHPHCPCTRASIGHLSIITTHCLKKIDIYVCFYKPATFSKNWEKTDLWKKASKIPGVKKVILDVDGEEASNFSAFTSGSVVMYNPQRKLLFKGGITSARGHYGDNIGMDSIIAIVNKKNRSAEKSPVYGCSIIEQKSLEECECKN